MGRSDASATNSASDDASVRLLARSVGSLWDWPTVRRAKPQIAAEVCAANLFATVWAVPARADADGGAGEAPTHFVSAHWWDSVNERQVSYGLAYAGRPSLYRIAGDCAELFDAVASAYE